MQNIVHSVWFALITGFASILGAVLTFYSFRVRSSKLPILRRMEWEKSILVSLSLGIMVFSFISFYNQKPPPKEPNFRRVYDILHGVDELTWEERDIYLFSAKVEGSGYLVELKTVAFFENRTRILFRSEPQFKKVLIEDFDPFPNPRIAIGFSDQFHLIDKSYSKSSRGELEGSLEFPNLANKTGSLYLWADGKINDELTFNNATFVLTLKDNRGNGTLIWGILFIISLAFIILGLFYNPTKSFKNKLLEEGREIQEEKNRALDKILIGRTYERLSFDEKRQYDEISQYYEKIQDRLLEVLTGHMEPSKNHKS